MKKITLEIEIEDQSEELFKNIIHFYNLSASQLRGIEQINNLDSEKDKEKIDKKMKGVKKLDKHLGILYHKIFENFQDKNMDNDIKNSLDICDYLLKYGPPLTHLKELKIKLI